MFVHLKNVQCEPPNLREGILKESNPEIYIPFRVFSVALKRLFLGAINIDNVEIFVHIFRPFVSFSDYIS